MLMSQTSDKKHIYNFSLIYNLKLFLCRPTRQSDLWQPSRDVSNLPPYFSENVSINK